MLKKHIFHSFSQQNGKQPHNTNKKVSEILEMGERGGGIAPTSPYYLHDIHTKGLSEVLELYVAKS